MPVFSAFTTPSAAHRLLSIVAICVFLCGRTFHVHQVGEACDCNEVVVQKEVVPCPFGCEHHAEPEGDDAPGPSSHSHDEHGCAVCSVLAASPECASLVGIEHSEAMNLASPLVEDVLPVSISAAMLRLRGPPRA